MGVDVNKADRIPRHKLIAMISYHESRSCFIGHLIRHIEEGHVYHRPWKPVMAVGQSDRAIAFSYAIEAAKHDCVVAIEPHNIVIHPHPVLVTGSGSGCVEEHLNIIRESLSRFAEPLIVVGNESTERLNEVALELGRYLMPIILEPAPELDMVAMERFTRKRAKDRVKHSPDHFRKRWE